MPTLEWPLGTGQPGIQGTGREKGQPRDMYHTEVGGAAGFHQLASPPETTLTLRAGCWGLTPQGGRDPAYSSNQNEAAGLWSPRGRGESE